MAKINDYNLIRNDRCDRRAGGVALYIHPNYKFKILVLSKNTALDFFAEYLICEIELNASNKLFVAIAYRSPNTPFFKGTNFLQVLSNLSLDYSSKLVLGDFNSKMLTINPQSSIMKDFISSNNLQLVTHGITHIKNDSSSYIDLCIIDANDTIADFYKSNGPFLHHHFLISVVLEIFLPSSTKNDFMYRNLWEF